MNTFSKDALPSNPSAWPTYQKKTLTKAVRIEGPFRVITAETENEPFLCQNGYLALDARGYPYAIAKAEFELIYDPAHSTTSAQALTDSQRLNRLRQILPKAHGNTVDQLIDSQANLMAHAQTLENASLSTAGATTQQVPPGD